MEIMLNEKYKVTVFSQENEGLGVSKIDNMVVFIENGLPGDSGDVLITEIKKNFARGKMVSFENKANGRQEAPCPYYGKCGGCDLQHQAYAHQLVFKEHKVKTALERIGGLKDLSINSIVFDDEFNYRNKVTLKIKGNKLGFYHHNTNEIIDIDNCLISHRQINEAIRVMRSFINEYKDNTFNALMIRYSKDGLMIKIDGEDDALENELVTFVTANLSNIKSLTLNNHLIYGSDFIMEYIGEYQFKLSPLSFYQVNNVIMNKLYGKVSEYVSQKENNIVLDLYCGIGTMTSILSKYSKKVIGIEVVSDAVKNALENIEINHITNVTFIEGKVENKIGDLLEENIDTIVMDPPRNGVDKKALEAVLQIEPQQIIYVSCNPVTLARDLKILSEKYNLMEVTPYDMFPQTSHVECVKLLTLKKSQ